MPFIDVKLSQQTTEEKKQLLKSELGKAVAIIHKPESYLMVGICDGYDLYFSGEKLKNGAFVSISSFGSIMSVDAQKMTKEVCKTLKDIFAIDGKNVYITYTGINNWGWNGGNF